VGRLDATDFSWFLIFWITYSKCDYFMHSCSIYVALYKYTSVGSWYFELHTVSVIILCIRVVSKIQDTRYFIFQIRAPGGHDTTFIISTYTINKVKYSNYCITINRGCHRLEQREVIQARLSLNFIFSLSI
jgi:hypothetical protein